MAEASQDTQENVADIDKVKVGLFTSAGGEGSVGLIKSVVENVTDGNLPNIDLVWVAVVEHYGMHSSTTREVATYIKDYLGRMHIPLMSFTSTNFSGGGLLDSHLVAALKEHVVTPDVGILAGYKNFAYDLLNYCPLLNIHPSIAGRYHSWWDTCIEKMLNNGDREGGITIHYVTTELDEGKVYTETTYPVVLSGIPVKDMRKFVRNDMMRHEQQLLVKTLKEIDIEEIRNHTLKTQFDSFGKRLFLHDRKGWFKEGDKDKEND